MDTQLKQSDFRNHQSVQYFNTLNFNGLVNIGGYDVALSIFDSAKKQGKKEKQNYYRLENMTKKISMREKAETEDIIRELDRKIEQAVVN